MCAWCCRLGAGCPSNYNPADFFIQLLAVVPTREESCRQTIEMVCDAFHRSEYGLKVQHDADGGNDLLVSGEVRVVSSRRGARDRERSRGTHLIC